MVRKKRANQQLINITEAAALCELHRWQVRRVCEENRLTPVPNPAKPDRRNKWFPKMRLMALLQAEYLLPLAS